MTTFRVHGRAGVLMKRLLAHLFGCRHRHLTFPLTIKKRTWRTCLDCGAEVIYDLRGGEDGVLVEVWDEMRRRHRVFVHASVDAPLLGAL